MKITTSEQAVKAIKSGDRVFVHSAAASPQQLVTAMTARAHELRAVEVVHLHTEGDAPYASPAYAESFHHQCPLCGRQCARCGE
jgi:4-hydroxybutyrate CoA-transferase